MNRLIDAYWLMIFAGFLLLVGSVTAGFAAHSTGEKVFNGEMK